MRIAITGGAGFIGSQLAKAYLNAGHEVLIIDNVQHRSASIDPRARFYQIDVRDSKLHTLFQQARPDLVSHHAAQPRDTIAAEQSLADADVHVRGLLNVLESCISASVKKVIFASSGNTLYGHVEEEQLPVTEETPLSPRHPYDISKLAGEWYVRYYAHQYGMQHTILRYADVYGETESTYHPLTYCIRMLLQGQRPIIRGTGDEIRDHIFIDDVVRANLNALTKANNHTLHISSGRGATLKQLFHLVALTLGSDLEPVHISGTLTEDFSIIMDNSRTRKELAWQPQVTLAEGIRKSIEMVKQPSTALKEHVSSVRVGVV
jgi:UDP-glucose 4-epimerase